MSEHHSETLELYKSYVETIGNNEAKRLQANATYFGFAGAIVTIAATVDKIDHAIIAALGLFLSVIWFFTIKHHKNLATAKFAVLKTLEDELGHQPFQREWELYKANRWPVSLTTIETYSPLALGIGCLVYLVYTPITACIAVQCLKAS